MFNRGGRVNVGAVDTGAGAGSDVGAGVCATVGV